MTTEDLIFYLESRPVAMESGVCPEIYGQAVEIQRAATCRAMKQKQLTWAEVLRDRFHEIMAASPYQLLGKLNQMEDVIDLWREDLRRN